MITRYHHNIVVFSAFVCCFLASKIVINSMFLEICLIQLFHCTVWADKCILCQYIYTYFFHYLTCKTISLTETNMYIFNSFVLKSFFKHPLPFIIKLPMILVVTRVKGRPLQPITVHSLISQTSVCCKMCSRTCVDNVFFKVLEVGVVVLIAIY